MRPSCVRQLAKALNMYEKTVCYAGERARQSGTTCCITLARQWNAESLIKIGVGPLPSTRICMPGSRRSNDCAQRSRGASVRMNQVCDRIDRDLEIRMEHSRRRVLGRRLYAIRVAYNPERGGLPPSRGRFASEQGETWYQSRAALIAASASVGV